MEGTEMIQVGKAVVRRGKEEGNERAKGENDAGKKGRIVKVEYSKGK